MAEGGWKIVDNTAEPARPLSILAPEEPIPSRHMPSLTTPEFLAPGHYVRCDPGYIAQDATKTDGTSRPTKPVSDPQPYTASALYDIGQRLGYAVSERPLSLTNDMAATYSQDVNHIGYALPPPSGIALDYSKKEYCTHWIRTGECEFTGIGGIFKHEIPPTPILCELGFLDLPRWFKVKSGIETRGPTWLQRRCR
ncbi:hypothetical protein K458DRAFT_194591 [Lentithecium fluviatile CBS 122367]|uniref:C3H1-type domain-containing protein n=1 Tax=Lentithecium fluviatile CBS 122367 TaxID=1168545 RepID=A0A6G1IDN5_9PLEO|nr:hypothetical protein K458DRAFT_194591 [Lentithecium fluviatile CBS 122367]